MIFIQFVFVACQVEGYRNLLKLSSKALAFTLYKAFLKTKKRSDTSLSASFSMSILKKSISLVILYQLTKYPCLFAFTSLDIGQ